MERRAACTPTKGAPHQHPDLHEMRKTRCFSWETSPGSLILSAGTRVASTQEQCASRVPTEILSAGPREAVQAPNGAGYTAG